MMESGGLILKISQKKCVLDILVISVTGLWYWILAFISVKYNKCTISTDHSQVLKDKLKKMAYVVIY